MDTKAAFEKWWEDQSEQLPPNMMAFSAWQASRAAIEIEPPELQVIPDEESDLPDFSDWPMGFNEGVKASI